MTEPIFNNIGTNYNKFRRADKRIADAVKELLDLPAGSIIADIGAGTGNYSNALAESGYLIKAVEPSETMQSQAVANSNVTWLSGTAESIPLPGNSVNGVIVILALHHFVSVEDAVKEIKRICPSGPVVISTFDPRIRETFWFEEYFPDIWNPAFKKFPAIEEIADLMAKTGQWSAAIHDFPLPKDLSDLFIGAVWARPEMLLDENVRQSMSGFALADPGVVQKGMERLKGDLESGKWDNKYGDLRDREVFDIGYRFIKLRKEFS
jgi:ubiquinone/menaquinone biosynthesis C-methylase UbiE